MCGIIGYVGYRNAVPVLLYGLQRLEYRGYDSAGIAVLDRLNNKFIIEKKVGKIKDLQEHLWGKNIEGHIGIGHTRWATHGEPTVENAHPHISQSDIITLVHNGIIENYAYLKEELIKKGYQFKSQTDTEVIAHLIEDEYKNNPDKSLLQIALNVVKKLKGAYALGIISTIEPDKIIAVRKGSPLIIGVGENENFIASDIPAVLEYTKKFITLDDDEIAVITKDNIQIYNIHGEKVEKKPFKVNWDISVAEKAGYKHFMLKEIYEQPRTITDTITGFLSQENKELYEKIKDIQIIHIVACGTSYHAGLVGKFWIEKFAKIPVIVDYASEYRYRDLVIDDKTLVIAISQSGETADTRFAVLEAKKKGAKLLSIVNVVGSSLSRESDYVLYTYCGPEIGVAATKTFTAQLITLLLFSLKSALSKNLISEKYFEDFYHDLIKLPSIIERELKDIDKKTEDIAFKYHNAKDFLFLGRGLNYPIALEGALKLKEISYIHAEGYPAGEMKHGPIALIDENMPVVSIIPKDNLYEKMLSNIQEVKARKGKVISLITKGNKEVIEISDDFIEIEETNENLYPILTAIPLQLLAYHIATILGKDVDQPRNLAKTVTVE
ncbi:glutamine--fructose-6-phosphate transaminase (isomerizing) [Venenivibrio stagnispumantis]|uniref:Glutamine--fructose-6-phosphate aminotransferase [isomerizing] n=1 Tax=Venenivibrio stagnispumantis TaxID=407998 RepID=A0AA46AEN9_9AQUI|nr:glutamine--fructose-6-phosphate transaminase (isomerizing) [Venenivibrio stagnispumantis]MCW4573640.1 glutamine--fructose-6-phosphate transaminase (isomerizing) [Venenivibrio stagnispumantis]SMP14367.1 glucosamine--fructose-6-phosphate aminotransferase (isomerizing) [Venenivibrio stagnispumantis]